MVSLLALIQKLVKLAKCEVTGKLVTSKLYVFPLALRFKMSRKPRGRDFFLEMKV